MSPPEFLKTTPVPGLEIPMPVPEVMLDVELTYLPPGEFERCTWCHRGVEQGERFCGEKCAEAYEAEWG